MSEYSQEYFASRYLDVCRVAMLAGKDLAANGAEAYRIEDTVVRMLKTTGFSYTEAHSSVTGLMISLDDPSLDHEVTLVSRIENRTNDLSKISLTNDVSRHFVAGELSIEEAEKKLTEIQSRQFYPTLLTLPCYGFASAFFSFMFGGWPLDALVAFLIGMVVGLVAVLIRKIKMSEFVRLFIESTLLGFAFFLFFHVCHLGQHAGPILYGAIMPLVPGMLITASIRDLLNGDYMSGMARIVESFLIAIAIASGVSLIIHLVEAGSGSFDLTTPGSFFTIGTTWVITPEILFQVLCSFIASTAFIILFNAEPRHLIPCGLCGAFTWFIYALCARYGLGALVATLLAAFGASMLTSHLSVALKTPVTVFFTGAILCLVPGAGMFRTSYYFIARDFGNGMNSLIQTLEISGLIAVAILIHSALLSIVRHVAKAPKH